MIDNTTEPSTRSKLDVVRADFVDTLAISWQDLFHGFNKIKVITFSSGINFMYQLFDMFENVEIILDVKMSSLVVFKIFLHIKLN